MAGTGSQGQDRDLGGPALKVGLNSPWDLLLLKDRLFIAMAGPSSDLDVGPGEGHGRPLRRQRPREHPRRLAFDQQFRPAERPGDRRQNLCVADSEVSAIRAVPLDKDGAVKTMVGEGLFEFGDVDGEGDKVRLQHALGLAYHDGKLYVADTYNSKIKVIDPVKRTSKTFLGGEPAGWLATPLFSEPGGISYADGKLYVADTNAHRIRVVDVKTKAVSTLKLQGVEAPSAKTN